MAAQDAPQAFLRELAGALRKGRHDAMLERAQVVHRLEREVVQAARGLVDRVRQHRAEGKFVTEPRRQGLERCVGPQRVGLRPYRVVRVEQQRALPSAFFERLDQRHRRVLVVGVVVEQRIRRRDQFGPTQSTSRPRSATSSGQLDSKGRVANCGSELKRRKWPGSSRSVRIGGTTAGRRW